MPAHRRNGAGIFRSLGQRVMYGSNGMPNYETDYEPQLFYEQPTSHPIYTPIEYPVPPQYPTTSLDPWNFASTNVPRGPNDPSIESVVQVNPAIREALQAQEQESVTVPERHRGTRKAYIPGIQGQYFDKPTLRNILNTIRPYKERAAYEVFGQGINRKKNNGDFYHSAEERERLQRKYEQELEKAKKETEREEFSLLHQYRLSKHDSPNGLLGFGSASGSASKFINGLGPDVKGWKDMSPSEKDEFIDRENATRNTPERIVRRQRGQENALLAQGLQASRRQAEQEMHNLSALSPAEREQRRYNQQVQNYMGQQNAAEYRNQAQFIQDNQQLQTGQNRGRNLSVPEPVMNELITMMNSRPTQYVPVRRRPSINDRVMSSFDQNMFNPEFISEEA